VTLELIVVIEPKRHSGEWDTERLPRGMAAACFLPPLAESVIATTPVNPGAGRSSLGAGRRTRDGWLHTLSGGTMGRSWRRDRRGAFALTTALMLPIFMGASALVVDVGFVVIAKTRLQIAADAGALGAGYLLSNPTVKALAPGPQLTKYQAVALAEVDGATQTERLIGTLTTPVAVVVAADYSSVQVTLTSRAPAFFSGAIGQPGPVITATATAGVKAAGAKAASACILALSTTAHQSLLVDNNDNQHGITGAACGIYSNSNANDAIYENSGLISGSSIGTVGTAARSNSGSNVWTPTPTSGGSPVADPFLSRSVTVPATCDVTNGDFTSSQNQSGYVYKFGSAYHKSIFCGNTIIGGNGTTDTFDPGVYYIVNGNLTFNNAEVTTAAGVTFVLTGTKPGVLTWTNFSNTHAYSFSPPTTGPTAGITFWQTCDSAHTTTTSIFAGGSTLALSGAVYMPCGSLNLSNNVQLNAAPNSSMSIVASTIYAHGNAIIRAAVSTSGSAPSNVAVLTQ